MKRGLQTRGRLRYIRVCPKLLPVEIHQIIKLAIEKVDPQENLNIALMGSYARNKGRKYSDLDLVCFSEQAGIKDTVKVIRGKYVVISHVCKHQVNGWFDDPELATEYLGGLQNMRIIKDPNHYQKN